MGQSLQAISSTGRGLWMLLCSYLRWNLCNRGICLWMRRGIYDRKHNVVDLKQDAHKLTHVLYGFANLKEDGEVFLGVGCIFLYDAMRWLEVDSCYVTGCMGRHRQTLSCRFVRWMNLDSVFGDTGILMHLFNRGNGRWQGRHMDWRAKQLIWQFQATAVIETR